MKNAGISPCFRQLLCKIGIIITLLVTAGCIQQNLEDEDAWNWDAGNGMVNIRIPLSAAAAERAVLLLDDPSRPYITYYEAILRDHNNQTQYFIGSASAGESFLVVRVVPGKNYDVLVLAGANVTGQPNGVKVLLASGYQDNVPVIYGQQNTIPVPMTFHKTSESSTSAPAGFDASPGSSKFSYKPVITGVKAILQAAGAKTGIDVISRTYRTEVETYPVPYNYAHHYPALNSVVTAYTGNPGDTGSITVEFEDLEYSKLQPHTNYSYHYDLTYYGFSDPASGSSAWSMRRGITHDLQRPAGGAVLLRYGDYYVHREGSDANDGLSTVTPFKTLARAVAAVRAAGNPAMRTITVLGTLDAASEGASSEPASVFAILNGPAGEPPITITGLEIPDLTGFSKPVLSGAGSSKRVLYLDGADTKIVIENITITGGTARHGGGVYVNTGAAFTIQDNAVIKDNTATVDGGGVYVHGTGASFIMQGNAVIEYNTLVGNGGGGVYVCHNAEFTMRGNAVIKYNQKQAPNFGGGGVMLYDGGDFIMQDNAVIEHNTSDGTGGGVYIMDGGSSFTMQDNAVIKDNTANGTGGGVYIRSGAFTMIEGIIRGNTATGQGQSIYNDGGTVTVTAPSIPALAATPGYENSDIVR